MNIKFSKSIDLKLSFLLPTIHKKFKISIKFMMFFPKFQVLVDNYDMDHDEN